MKRRSLRVWLRQGWCAIVRGHDEAFKTDAGRVWLRCPACGHRSPGVRPGRPRFTRRFDGDPTKQTWMRLSALRSVA